MSYRKIAREKFEAWLRSGDPYCSSDYLRRMNGLLTEMYQRKRHQEKKVIAAQNEARRLNQTGEWVWKPVMSMSIGEAELYQPE